MFAAPIINIYNELLKLLNLNKTNTEKKSTVGGKTNAVANAKFEAKFPRKASNAWAP